MAVVLRILVATVLLALKAEVVVVSLLIPGGVEEASASSAEEYERTCEGATMPHRWSGERQRCRAMGRSVLHNGDGTNSTEVVRTLRGHRLTPTVLAPLRC